MQLLAMFMVFKLVAIQFESLRNPLNVFLSISFVLVGVAPGIRSTELRLSMPVKNYVDVLADVLVINFSVWVEYNEVMRKRGSDIHAVLSGPGA